jgi:UPF0042 nucleotide-binding protein
MEGRVGRCIIITGLSGAGKSTALNILEDQGYYAIDNIPPALLPQLLELLKNHRAAVRSGVAAVVDTRGEELLQDLLQAVSVLRTQGRDILILFLDASDEALIRRFNITRRLHPMALDVSVGEGIARERSQLELVREAADVVLDTTGFSIVQFRQSVLGEVCEYPGTSMVVITSFGFKYGVPQDCELLFDVRFLPNPHYIPTLREKNGMDPCVQEYLFSFSESRDFLTRVEEFLHFYIPKYLLTAKPRLHICIGCTGGHHRSVAIAQRIYDIATLLSPVVTIRHRDLGDDGGRQG